MIAKLRLRNWLPVLGSVTVLASAVLVPLVAFAGAGAGAGMTERCVAPSDAPSPSSTASPAGSATGLPSVTATVAGTAHPPVAGRQVDEEPPDPIIATRTPSASRSPSAEPCPTQPPATSPAAPTGTASPSATAGPSWTVSPSKSTPASQSCTELLPVDLMRAQEPLVEGAEQLLATGEALVGFSGITIEPEICTVRVYWDGLLPANVTAIVNALRTRMSVEVHDGPRYTRAELTAVAADLFDTLYQGMSVGVSVTRVSVRPEGTHVDVGVWPLPSVPPVDPAQAAARAQHLWETDLPVVVTAVPPTEVTSRWEDVQPWNAGGRLLTPANGKCSTGWPLGKSGGSSYMLTAAHCANAPYGTQISNGLGTNVIGTIEGYDTGMDAALIEVAAPADAGPRMWDGGVTDVRAPLGVNDDIEFTQSIVDWSETFVGMYLCTSGASTGVHCKIKVTDHDVSYANTLGWRVKHSAEAKQIDGKVAHGTGDSGGPIYSTKGDKGDVVAVGMIAGGPTDAVVPCGAHPSTTCFNRVIFTRMKPIRANWGLSNITKTGFK